MWNVKTNVVPLVIGATATISKSLRKCLGYIPGKHEIKKLQKTAILGTPLHLQEISPIPGTHLCYRPSRADGHTAAGRIGSMQNSNDPIGKRIRDLPVCYAMPKATALPHPYIYICVCVSIYIYIYKSKSGYTKCLKHLELTVNSEYQTI